MRKLKGFTLVELAIILVIIGLIAGSAFTAFWMLASSMKIQETKNKVNQVCEAVKGYAFQYKNLPDSITQLGISTEDGFGQSIKYSKATGITTDFCNENGDWLTVNDKGDVKDTVAFIVYSVSKNKVDDTDCSQSPTPCSSNTYDFQIRPGGETTNTGSNYDDVVCFVDINLLREKACPVFEITTSALPQAVQYLPYDSGSINVSGGSINNCTINITPTGTGLTGDTTNCKVVGTPTVSGTVQVSFEVEDAIGRVATKTFTITVNPNPVKIETPALPYAYKNQSYQVALTASGATGSYVWTQNSWDLDGDGDADIILTQTGILEANQDDPADANSKVVDVPPGTYSITVEVCDATYTSECTSRTYPFTVLSSTAGGGSSGGGGSGGTGCIIYTVVVDNQHRYKDVSYYINNNDNTCTDVRDGQSSTVGGLSGTDIFTLFENTDCEDTVLINAPVSSLDTDANCTVNVICTTSTPPWRINCSYQ